MIEVVDPSWANVKLNTVHPLSDKLKLSPSGHLLAWFHQPSLTDSTDLESNSKDDTADKNKDSWIVSIFDQTKADPIAEFRIDSHIADFGWLNDDLLLFGGYGDVLTIRTLRQPSGCCQLDLNFDWEGQDSLKKSWNLVLPQDENDVAYAVQPDKEVIRIEYRRDGLWAVKRRWQLARLNSIVENVDAESTWIVTNRTLWSLSAAHGLVGRPLLFSSAEAIATMILPHLRQAKSFTTKDGLSFTFVNDDDAWFRVELDSLLHNTGGATQFSPQPCPFERVREMEERALRIRAGHDLMPIQESDLFLSVKTGSVVALALSVRAALWEAIGSEEDLRMLSDINGWDTTLAPIVSFERALVDNDLTSSIHCLVQLNAAAYECKFSADWWIDLCQILYQYADQLVLDDSLFRGCSRLLIQGIRHDTNSQLLGETISCLRAKRLCIEQLNLEVLEQSVKSGGNVETEAIVVFSNTFPNTNYQVEQGWRFDSPNPDVSCESSVLETNTQRVRKALARSGLWSRWSTMNDRQIVSSALENGMVASACAYLRARFEAAAESMASENIDGNVADEQLDAQTFAYIRRIARERAFHLLCDFESVDRCLIRVDIDPFEFYRRVVLETFSRTLRRNILRHVTECMRRGLGDRDGVGQVDESIAFLKTMERIYPCKSYAVALRRSWSAGLKADRRLEICKEETDLLKLNFARLQWPGSCAMDTVTTQWRSSVLGERKVFEDIAANSLSRIDKIALETLKVASPKADARDGDDERCLDVTCQNCAVEVVAESLNTNPTDSHHLDARYDPFTSFFRFSLQSIVRSDEETRARMKLEGGTAPLDLTSLYTLRYLLDHNDWRGFELWMAPGLLNDVVSAEFRQRCSWLENERNSVSPLMRSLLGRYLLLVVDEDATDWTGLQRYAWYRKLLPHIKSEAMTLRTVEQLCRIGLADAVDVLLPWSIEACYAVLESFQRDLVRLRCLALVHYRLFQATNRNAHLIDCLLQSLEANSILDAFDFLETAAGPKYQLAMLSLIPTEDLNCVFDVNNDQGTWATRRGDWRSWSRRISQAWPEMLAAFPRRSSVTPSSESSAFGKDDEDRCIALLLRYGGMNLHYEEPELEPILHSRTKHLVPGSRLIPLEVGSALGPAYYLWNHRPLSAFRAWSISNERQSWLRIGRTVAMSHPHDGVIVETCCKFIDLCSHLRGEQQHANARKRALRVDALMLSTILTRLQEEMNLTELFVSLGGDLEGTEDADRESKIAAIQAFRLLGASQSEFQGKAMTGTTEEAYDDSDRGILHLLAEFCAAHGLPPSLGLLEDLARSGDTFGLLNAADEQQIDCDTLTDFIRGSSLPMAERNHVLASEGSHLLLTRDQVLDIIRGPTPCETLLRSSVVRAQPKLAAIATAFPKCDMTQAWASYLAAALKMTNIKMDSSNPLDFLLTMLALAFDELPKSRKVLRDSAEAFAEHFPALVPFVLFRCCDFQGNDVMEKSFWTDNLKSCYTSTPSVTSFLVAASRSWLMPWLGLKSDGTRRRLPARTMYGSNDLSVVEWIFLLEHLLAASGTSEQDKMLRRMFDEARFTLKAVKFLTDHMHWDDRSVHGFLSRVGAPLPLNEDHIESREKQLEGYFIEVLLQDLLFTLAYAYVNFVDRNDVVTIGMIVKPEVTKLVQSLLEEDSIRGDDFEAGLQACLTRLNMKQYPREAALELFRSWGKLAADSSQAKRVTIAKTCIRWLLDSSSLQNQEFESLKLRLRLIELGEELGLDLSSHAFDKETVEVTEDIDTELCGVEEALIGYLLGTKLDLFEAVKLLPVLLSQESRWAIAICSKYFKAYSGGGSILVEPLTKDNAATLGAKRYLRYLDVVSTVANNVLMPFDECLIASDDILQRLAEREENTEWFVADGSGGIYISRLLAFDRDGIYRANIRSCIELLVYMTFRSPSFVWELQDHVFAEALASVLTSPMHKMAQPRELAAELFMPDSSTLRFMGDAMHLRLNFLAARYSKSRKALHTAYRRYKTFICEASLSSVINFLGTLRGPGDVENDLESLGFGLRRIFVEDDGGHVDLLLSFVRNRPFMKEFLRPIVQSCVFPRAGHGVPTAFFDQIKLGQTFGLHRELACALEKRGEGLLSLVRHEDLETVTPERLQIIQQCLMESEVLYEKVGDEKGKERAKLMLENVRARMCSIHVVI